MPIYEFVCPGCQKETEVFVHLHKDLEKEDLSCCGQRMRRKWTPIPHIIDFEPHFSPTVDKKNIRPYFSTKREMVDWYKRNDLILEKV